VSTTRAVRRPRRVSNARAISRKKSSLVGKFRIEVGIGNIRARGDVEIVQFHAVFENRRNVPAIVFAAIPLCLCPHEGQTRENRYAVVAFLAADCLVEIAGIPERFRGKKDR